MVDKLCKDCGQPMLPKGVKKRPDYYDHAQGCPSAPAPSPVSDTQHKYSAYTVPGTNYHPHSDSCPCTEAAPASEQDEMELSDFLKDRCRGGFAEWLEKLDQPFPRTVIRAFATREVAAERKRVREEDCKAVCRNCELGVPIVLTETGVWEHTETKLPWRVCKAAAIRRKLEER